MIRRPAAIATLALAVAVSLGGGAAVIAQEDYGVNAGDYEASSSGSDGNIVVSGGDRIIEGLPRPSRTASTPVPTATPAPSGPVMPGPVVIPPNPALEGRNDRGTLDATVVEETTSGESVIGPPPTPAPDEPEEEAVTADDSASSGGAGDAAAADSGRRTGDASVSAVDGSTTGGSVNEVIPATTTSNPSGSTPSTSGSSSRGSRGACGYPTWLDAQTALETEWSVELADVLDPDRDGIACEEAMN